MKNNVGSGVSGFDVKVSKDPMLMFDRLPRRVRDALNYANAEWSVEYFAEWKFLGEGAVATMVSKSDEEWTKTAYRERGLA
jgi:hypothetical protein